MKLTKSGEIEACCSYGRDQFSGVREYVKNPNWTRGGALIRIPISFGRNCPNCGAKTEIEGEEKHE